MDVTTITTAQLDTLRVERQRAADSAAVEVLGAAAARGGVPTRGEKARVNRLSRAWEAVLDEYERRGLLVAH